MKERSVGCMPTIQETISKAIMAKGTIILKNRAALCIAIEDLSPDLSEELKFIKKVYNDEIGGILYEALIEGNIVKKRDILMKKTEEIQFGEKRFFPIFVILS